MSPGPAGPRVLNRRENAQAPSSSSGSWLDRGDEIYIREGHVFRKPAGKNTFQVEPDSYIKGLRTGLGGVQLPDTAQGAAR